MQIDPLTRLDQIKDGDLLLIDDGKTVIQAVAKFVKVSEYDGVEVIIKRKRNRYFNVGYYLEGRSWAKEIFVIKEIFEITKGDSQTKVMNYGGDPNA